MISHIQIQHFAIVDHLELDLQSEMTVLTGETGAGKSIIIDALGIALGDRADQSLIRQQSQRAEVVVTFNIHDNHAAQTWLAEHELEADKECILRRTITRESGSRAYLNGRPVPLQLVKQLAENLTDIHSQHQHQSLLRREEQRYLLDNYAGHLDQTRQLQDIYRHYAILQQQFNKLSGDIEDRSKKIAFLKYQINEIHALQLQEDEWKHLDSEHQRLANIEKIHQSLNTALDTLYDSDGAVLAHLSSIKSALSETSQYQPELQATIELVETASIQLEEAVSELRAQQLDTDIDRNEFEHIENRITAILDISRKHRCQPDDLLNELAQLENELAQIETIDVQLEDIEQDIQTTLNQYHALAIQISQTRAEYAKKLATKVSQLLQQLGMLSCQFLVALEPLKAGEIKSFGLEKIEFQVITNAGQPAKPLAKVASGGELSRISLAIQVVTTQVAHIPSLVFDEVDVGISGQVAEIVGDLLKQLGQKRQIICITHQAQVAAKGTHHLFVKKATNTKGDGQIGTHIEKLNKTQRVQEIARMIGGIQITEATKHHAREMLTSSATASNKTKKPKKQTTAIN